MASIDRPQVAGIGISHSDRVLFPEARATKLSLFEFDVATGKQAKAQANAPSYTKVFGESLVKEARKDDKIVAITAAHDGRENGLISSTAVTASLLPESPRLTVQLSKANLTHDLVLASGALAVHFLPDDERGLALFRALGTRTGRETPKLDDISTVPPRLRGPDAVHAHPLGLDHVLRELVPVLVGGKSNSDCGLHVDAPPSIASESYAFEMPPV